MKRLILCFTGILLNSVTGVAADSDLPSSHADWILDAIDCILTHDVDPPTRQELLLAAMKELHRGRNFFGRSNMDLSPAESAEMSAEISKLSSSEDFRAQLTAALNQRTISNELRMEKAVLEALQRTASSNRAFSQTTQRLPRFNRGPSDDPDDSVSNQMAENRYVGIGILLGSRSLPNERDLYPTAMKVFPRGPAYSAGMRDGDLMLTIDGDSMKQSSTTKQSGTTSHQRAPFPIQQEVIKRLRGQEGVPVTIEVQQPGEKEIRTLTFNRGVAARVVLTGWHEESPGYWDHVIRDGVAYVQIQEIGSSTVHDLKRVAGALELKALHTLVLDLRHVINSNLNHTVMLADALLDGGVIGEVARRRGTKRYHADADSIFDDWELKVLIDESVRGLPEWLAFALKRHGRATLIGTSSAGDRYLRESIQTESGKRLLIETAILKPGSGHPRADFGKLMPDISRRQAESFLRPEDHIAIEAFEKFSKSFSRGWGVVPRRVGTPWETIQRRIAP